MTEAPLAQVRPMSTDRPDTTESAYTVPAGMFQMEAGFFDYERDASSGSRTETSTWGQINFKAGLTDSMDLQLVFDSYQEVRTSTAGSTLRQSGFGDVILRLKKNLWGNDAGRSAFALMPYVSIPTGTELSANAWRGGLIAPFAYELSDRLAFGAMGQMDMVHDAETQGYDLQWLASATLGLAVTDRAGMYFEAVAAAGEDVDFIALFNTGVTYAVTDNLVFDAGVRIGLNRPAPDFGIFSGVSFRF
ncbi:transporter [Prosthecobacter sp. SYSU 5D2]|uniref:transporter n=1 Tax=Prosthecobacter sp. SYSU 5D2 TaxID=3134134 RepID=UPI0031FEE37D